MILCRIKMSVFDLNDCYTKDEVYIYKSVLDLYGYVFLYVLLVIGSVFTFCLNKGEASRILLGLALLLGAVVVFLKSRSYAKELKEIQVTMNLKGVKFKDRPFVLWENIENERIGTIVKKVRGESDEIIYYFTCYCKDINTTIEIFSKDISIEVHVFLSVFKIFRYRSKQTNA